MSEKKTGWLDRRTVIRAIGTSAIAGGISTLSSSSVVAESLSTDSAVPDTSLVNADKDEVKQYFAGRYPTPEINYLAARWDKYRSLYLGNSISKNKAFIELTEDIKKHTTKMANGIKQSEKHRNEIGILKSHSKKPTEFIKDSSTNLVSTSSTPAGCGGEESISYGYNKYTDTGGTGVTSARTLDPNQIEANSSGYGYANCYAVAERGGNYYSHGDGELNISVEYARSGAEDTKDGGECEIFLFVQDPHTDATESFLLESGDTSGSTVCKGVTSKLAQSAGDLRVLLQISTSAKGWGGTIYADYYSGTKGVKIKGIYATEL
ncbi:hypothetical protein [Haloarchaeobius sp. DYHT-AS-18]|uniref:hypothetical protein n=1 Tax=Haloarchaeobius sp. DYHT-AS-18 TaxID=3446117 RepID=UPI003EBCB967